MNKALLSKWGLWFANERDYLWRRVINSKFGVDSGGWCMGGSRGRFWQRSMKRT